MKWFVRFGLTLVISLGLAVMVSVLPVLDPQTRPTASDTSSTHVATHVTKPVIFDDSNLVDYLSELSMHGELSKVSWSYSVLSIDLEYPRQLSIPELYRDLISLTHFGFDDTSNVKHMLVRVVRSNGKATDEELLVSITANREEWEQMKQDYNGNESWEMLFDTYFTMKYTEAWEQLTRGENVPKL